MDLKEGFNVVSFHFDNNKFMEYFAEGVRAANQEEGISAWTSSFVNTNPRAWSINKQMQFPGILPKPNVPGYFSITSSRSRNNLSITAELLRYDEKREVFWFPVNIVFNFSYTEFNGKFYSKIDIDFLRVHSFEKYGGFYEEERLKPSSERGRFKIFHDWDFPPYKDFKPILEINTDGLIGYNLYQLHLNCYAIIARELIKNTSSLRISNKEHQNERSNFMEKVLLVIEGEINLPSL